MQERKRAVVETFGAAAETYGTGPDFFWPLGAALAEHADVGPGRRVLDVAAGTGAVAVAAAERGAEVVAIDLAPAMVERARERGVDARLGDAERPDFPDGSFDAVLCGFAVFFLPDPAGALREWWRVLRPGGTVALSTFVRRDTRWAWMSDLLPSLPDRAGADVFDDSREGLTALLEGAGFGGVRFAERRHELVFESAEQWWAWLWSHGHRGVLTRLSEEQREAFRRAAFERVAAMGPPVRNTIRARLTAARRA